MPDSQESSTDNRPQKNAECASDRWTPAVFLDKAQELKRRLAVWQFHDAEEPEWIETFLISQEVIRWTFRDVIFKGENGPRPKPSRQYLDYGLASKVNEAAGMVGTVFRNLPTDANKHLTRWLLRDFYEHLPDAGNGARAQFLKLKVDRILDAQMYCTRELKEGDDLYTDVESGGKGDERPRWLIDGHPVEPTLLDEFIEAVQALWQASADTIDAQCARQQLDFTYPFEFVAVSRTSDIANSLIGVANRLYERMLKWNYPEDVDWDDSSPEFHERQNQRYFFTFERPLHEDFQQHDFDQARVWLKINAPVVYEEIEGAVANLETRMPLAATANMDACNDLATDFAKVAFELVRVAHEIVRYERGNEGSKEAWSGQQPKPATATGERIISSSDIADLAQRAILELSSLISGTGFTEDDIPHFDFGIPAYDAVSELLACDGQRFLLEEKVEVNFTGDPLKDPWWEVLRATRKGKCLSGMTKERAILELIEVLEEKYLRNERSNSPTVDDRSANNTAKKRPANVWPLGQDSESNTRNNSQEAPLDAATEATKKYETELRKALESRNIRVNVEKPLTVEQKRNIIMVYWKSEGLTSAKIRDRWQENKWSPSLGSQSKTKLASKVKTCISRGNEKLKSLANKKV